MKYRYTSWGYNANNEPYITIETKNGYHFYLGSHGATGDFSIMPDPAFGETRDGLDNGDKELWETLADLRTKPHLSTDNLLELYYDLQCAFGISTMSGAEVDPLLPRVLRNKNIPIPTREFIIETCEWVYVVGNKEEGLYKIGMTRRKPSERLKEFAPKLPFETEILATIPSKNAIRLEKEYHAMFSDKRTNGEWFRLDENDLCLLCGASYDC